MVERRSPKPSVEVRFLVGPHKTQNSTCVEFCALRETEPCRAKARPRVGVAKTFCDGKKLFVTAEKLFCQPQGFCFFTDPADVFVALKPAVLSFSVLPDSSL